MTCGRCTAPTADGIILCDLCVGHLRDTLTQAPDTLADAEDTIARLTSRTGNQRTSAEPPAPLNIGAAQRRDELTYLLTSWSDLLRDETGHPGTGAHYLRAHLRHIARQDWAPDMADELEKAHRRLHAAVDVQPDRRTLGPCHDPHCTGTVTGTTRNRTARCTTCGARYDAAELIQTAVANAWAQAAPLTTILRAMDAVGIRIPRPTAQSWVRRGHLEPAGAADDGTALYTMAQLWETRAALQNPAERM